MHHGGNTTFTCDLTPYLHEGDNMLAVSVMPIYASHHSVYRYTH